MRNSPEQIAKQIERMKGNSYGKLNKGKPLSEGHRRNVGKALAGKSWIDRVGEKKAAEMSQNLSNKLKGRRMPVVSNDTRQKLSDALKGRSWNELYGKERADELRLLASKKFVRTNTGRIHSEEFKEKQRARTGPKSSNWLGGHKNYRGDDWQIYRKAAIKRDGYHCQDCGTYRRKLDVHHIIPFRLVCKNELDNLITLCKSCHKKWDHYWNRCDKFYSAGSNVEDVVNKYGVGNDY